MDCNRAIVHPDGPGAAATPLPDRQPMEWPFGRLRRFGYDAILADPPWSYKMYSAKGYEKSPEAHYSTMSDDDLYRLPVGSLAGRTCVLFLWATWPKLPVAHECIRRWGFQHITGGAWLKTTKDGEGLRIGTGYSLRSACEPFLIARMGESQARLTDVSNVIISPGREHSRKPPEARAMLERMTPNAWRCELFGREQWPGNDVWGNETGKFTP